MFNFALNNPSGQKIYTKVKIKLLKKMHKYVLSLMPFYLDDDDHKPVDFNRETGSFTCQLVKTHFSDPKRPKLIKTYYI